MAVPWLGGIFTRHASLPSLVFRATRSEKCTSSLSSTSTGDAPWPYVRRRMLDELEPLPVAVEVVARGQAVAEDDVDVLAVGDGRRRGVAAGGVVAAGALAGFEVAVQGGQLLALGLELVDLGLEPLELLLGLLLRGGVVLQHFPESGTLLLQGRLLLAELVVLLALDLELRLFLLGQDDLLPARFLPPEDLAVALVHAEQDARLRAGEELVAQDDGDGVALRQLDVPDDVLVGAPLRAAAWRRDNGRCRPCESRGAPGPGRSRRQRMRGCKARYGSYASFHVDGPQGPRGCPVNRRQASYVGQCGRTDSWGVR